MPDNATAAPCLIGERCACCARAGDRTNPIPLRGIAGLASACVAVWLLFALLPAGGVETVPTRSEFAWEQAVQRQMRLKLFAQSASSLVMSEVRADEQERPPVQRAAAAPAAGAPLGIAGDTPAAAEALPADAPGRAEPGPAPEAKMTARLEGPVEAPGEAPSRPGAHEVAAVPEARGIRPAGEVAELLSSDPAGAHPRSVVAPLNPEIASPGERMGAQGGEAAGSAANPVAVAAPPATTKRQTTKGKTQRSGGAGGGAAAKPVAASGAPAAAAGNRNHWRSVFGDM